MVETASTLIKSSVEMYDLIKRRKEKDNDYELFENIYEQIILSLEKKYLNLEVELLFNNDAMRAQLFAIVLSDKNLELDEINQYIDINSIPNSLINELIHELKQEVLSSPLTKYISSVKQNNLLESIDKSLIEIQENLTSKIATNKFLKTYKSSAIRKYSRIKFFDIQLPTIGNGPKEKSIDDLFVTPMIYDEDKDFSFYANTLDSYTNLVILGNPGSGKSTLTKYLLISTLKENSEYIPIRVELKDYYFYIEKSFTKTLTSYIVGFLNDKFSTAEINVDNIDNVFQKEKFIFFFDGLDEVFSEEKRSFIRDQIEHFVSTYKSNKVIVTSRIEGYKETQFDSDLFSIAQIQNFSGYQIEAYVNKWLTLEFNDEEIKEEYKDKFYGDMYLIDDEILSNPFMLSIVLILFSRDFSIPTSKLAFYESCTSTLVDRWEESKNFGITIEKKIQALSYLAFWQYERKTVLSNEEVVNSMIKFYESFQDDYSYEEAKKLGRSFMEYLYQRSIYFDNNFVHKTFLEYYTANYIYTKFEKKGKIAERNKIITKYITSSYWFVVLELLISMIDKGQHDNEVMEELIDYHCESLVIVNIVFFVKNIRYIKNISNNYRKRFLKKAFMICIESAKNNYQGDVGISTCSDEVTLLHDAFNYLSDSDYDYILVLANELVEEYGFEVAAFFTELDISVKDFSNSLKKYNHKNIYSASMLFDSHEVESYNNWEYYFHTPLIESEIFEVYNSKELLSNNLISRIIYLILRYFKEDSNFNQAEEVINAMDQSRMQFHKIYLSESSISILFENIFSELDEKNSVLIPKILTLSNSNSLKSYILALIYLNEKNRNTSYILAFDKLEKKYKNLLLSYYERDEELTTGEKIFYDLEKMDKQR